MRLLKRSFLSLLLFGLCQFTVQHSASANETRFTVVDSSPTSWVARGFSGYTVSPDVGWLFNVSRNFDNGIHLDISGQPLSGTEVDYWGLDFATPFSVDISSGLYEDFQKWPVQDDDRPGVRFTSTGRADNRNSGFFEVHEARYADNGDVLAFSADFIHFGEEDINNYAIVEIRFNASVPVVEPDSLSVFRGNQAAGQFIDLLSSDDSRISFHPGFTINDLEAPIWLILDGELGTDQPQDLELSLESQSGTPGITCTVEAWNWNLNQYDVVSEFAESFNNDTITAPNLGATSSDYAEDGTGAVRARLGWRQTGFVINFPWVVSIDHFNWSSN